MRIVLTIVPSILAGAALAQSPTPSAYEAQLAALTDKEVAIQWEKLMIISGGDTEGEAIEHLRSHGMDIEGAKALRALHAKAEAEMKMMSNQFFSEVCAKQEELREGGPEMLAQVIESQRTRTTAARRRLLAEANGLLSLADQERLEHLFTSDHGPKVGLTDSNVASRVRDGTLRVEQAIARACEIAKGKKEGG